MTNKSKEEDEMPSEIDFSKASRGLHHLPADARVFLPALVSYMFVKDAAPEWVPLPNDVKNFLS